MLYDVVLDPVEFDEGPAVAVAELAAVGLAAVELAAARDDTAAVVDALKEVRFQAPQTEAFHEAPEMLFQDGQVVLYEVPLYEVPLDAAVVTLAGSVDVVVAAANVVAAAEVIEAVELEV